MPIAIRCTAQLHFKASRLPDFSTMVKWVFALFDGRLWYRRPVCLGFEGKILRVAGQKQIGTEIVLERKDL